ncbi:hypothetical protein [Nocardiopsis kunsanensis]|nr:hypothetical protein [Nocardiopsis kunsanensis]
MTMKWTLRAHPGWQRRELRVRCEEHESEEAREPSSDAVSEARPA